MEHPEGAPRTDERSPVPLDRRAKRRLGLAVLLTTLFIAFIGLGTVVTLGAGLYVLYQSWRISREKPAATAPEAK